MSMPLKSRQMVAPPQSSLKRGKIVRAAAIDVPFSLRSDDTMIAPTSAPHVPSIVPMPEPKPEPSRNSSSSLLPSSVANATSTAWQQFISLLRLAA